MILYHISNKNRRGGKASATIFRVGPDYSSAGFIVV